MAAIPTCVFLKVYRPGWEFTKLLTQIRKISCNFQMLLQSNYPCRIGNLWILMISASKTTLNLKNIRILRLKVKKSLTTLHTKFCESPPCIMLFLATYSQVFQTYSQVFQIYWIETDSRKRTKCVWIHLQGVNFIWHHSTRTFFVQKRIFGAKILCQS
jgi:hypothetical protein